MPFKHGNDKNTHNSALKFLPLFFVVILLVLYGILSYIRNPYGENHNVAHESLYNVTNMNGPYVFASVDLS